jgi:site-specific recombinase XerD
MRLSAFIHQFFDKYLPHIKGVSPNSIKAYRDTFKLFLPFAASLHGINVGSLSLNHFTPEVIVGFLEHLESERENTARTRNHRLAAIKSLAKMIRLMHPQWSASMDKIISIPQKRTQRQLIGFLYPEEINQVLSEVNIDTAVGFRDYTILHLLFESGARASEVARLNVDYFDPEKGTLTILGKGNRFRQVNLSPTTVKMIKAYMLKHRRTPKPVCANRMFISQHGKALTRHGIYRLCRKYLHLALSEKRLEVLNPVHSFRHSCAIAMLASGCSVTDIKNHLGHEDIQSTMVYLQLDLPRRRKIQQRFTEYTQAVLSRNAEIEALIDKQEEDDIMKWLDSL